MTDERTHRLQDLIACHSMKRGEFVLTSGRTSDVHFELGKTILNPEGAVLIANLILDWMIEKNIRCIGGPAMGAVPLVSAVALASFHRNWPVYAFYVRKEAKAHGAKQHIDGHVAAGSILLVDDVATSGGSLIGAYDAMNEINTSPSSSHIKHALVVLDREEGATEALKASGITLHSLVKKSDFD